MTSPVVFDKVWKKFRRGERHDSLRDLIPATIGALTGRRPAGLAASEFWALEDVSFKVEAGRALGIIGPNGAGKSTTLKLLTRILRPTNGECRLTGSVGALIEIAAGFHPDLTGRENIFLQGAIMGMKRAEVKARFDEIVGFAEIGDFVDTQVKRYSSGMNARLGFSIAAHLHPDVLIVDEVLSVGDEAFQERCIERMRAFKDNGVAVVFVSHNLQSIVDLCDEALYLHREIKSQGSVMQVVDAYVKDAFAPADEESNELRIVAARLTTRDHGAVVGAVMPGGALRLEVEFATLAPIDEVTFAMRLHRRTDQLRVYEGAFSQREVGVTSVLPARFTVAFDFDANLTRGQYDFDVLALHAPSHRTIARLRPAARITIADSHSCGGFTHLATRVSLHGPGQTVIGETVRIA